MEKERRGEKGHFPGDWVSWDREGREEWLVEEFKWLHRHPELGLLEYKTTERLREILQGADIELLDIGMETGLIAVIGKGKAVVGLRADIDALPIQEETGLSYASEHEGVMHACGHDFHAATLLGAALLLKEREEELPGRVKLIFQPAEEINKGGDALASSGLLDDVKAFYAGHTYPWFPPGKLGIKPGPVMASADRFSIKLKGKGAHAAHPELSVDVIPAMAALIQSVQTIVSRTVNPFDSAVISITRLHSGSTWNIIPEEGELEGTVRALIPSLRDTIQRRLGEMAESIGEAYGVVAEYTYDRYADPVINDEDAAGYATSLAREMGFEVAPQADTLGAEDFSAYLRIAPGAFLRIGTGGSYDAHHPKFTVDPRALFPAAEYFAALAEAELRRLSES